MFNGFAIPKKCEGTSDAVAASLLKGGCLQYVKEHNKLLSEPDEKYKTSASQIRDSM